MIGLYIAANVGKYLFRSSAKYGYTGLVGGGLISKAGRGVGMAVRGKYKKVGDAIYDFFNEGGIGNSLLAGKTSTRVDNIMGTRAMPNALPNSARHKFTTLGLDDDVFELVNKSLSGQKLTIREHRKIIRGLGDVGSDLDSLFNPTKAKFTPNGWVQSPITGEVKRKFKYAGLKTMSSANEGASQVLFRHSSAVVSQHNKRVIKAGAITAGSAYIASLTTRKAFEAMQAVESNAINFAASIGEYEAIRAIPMMNTMQATTERAAALQYIQQSRTNARSLLGQEAALRHGV